jgi:hypothetical protein
MLALICLLLFTDSCLRAEIDASLRMAAESKQSKWTELFRGSNGVSENVTFQPSMREKTYWTGLLTATKYGLGIDHMLCADRWWSCTCLLIPQVRITS